MKRIFLISIFSVILGTSLFAITVLAADAPHIITISPMNGPVGTELEIRGENFSSTYSLNSVIFYQSESGNKNSAIGIKGDDTYFVVKIPQLTVGQVAQVRVESIGADRIRKTSDNYALFTVDAAKSAPSYTSSQTSGQSGTCLPGQICNPLAYDNLEDLINTIIWFLIKVGTPIAAIMFVIAGILFVTSAGDSGRIKTARGIMIYTAVGLGVIILASGLIKVIQSLLGGS